MKTAVAGVDLGGTGSRFVVCVDRTVVNSRTLATASFAAAATADRLDRLVAEIRALVPPDLRLTAVGIGASGPVDIQAGMVRNPDTLAAFSGFPLVHGLAQRLGVEVVIDNDAVTAAVAEQRLGAGRGARRMLMVTLGTGIGAALLIDGRPFRGADGAHPEAGHIPIVEGGGRCYCGAEGCWEMAASRSALQRLLKPLLPAAVADRDLIEAAAGEADRPETRRAFRQYGTCVGRGLAALHTILQPDVTVLGGSAARAFACFEDGLREALVRTPGFAVPVSVRVATLGDEAGALGAAQLALSAATDRQRRPETGAVDDRGQLPIRGPHRKTPFP